MSADRAGGTGLRGVEPSAQRVLRVQTTFHLADEAQGHDVAAKLIDRAHELASSPECECDVDVSVEWGAPEDLPVDPGGGGVPTGDVTPADRRSAGEHPAAR